MRRPRSPRRSMSPPDQEQNAPLPTPGMTVKSRFFEDWGSGTVLNVQGNGARVLFTSHPAKKPVLVPVRSLVVTRAGDWAGAARAMAEGRGRSESATSSGRKSARKKLATTTQEQAVQLFLERFPGGFAGETFTKTEREPRWSAHLAFAEHLGGSRLRDLLAEGKAQDAARLALEAVQKTTLLSVFEKARLKQAFADEAYAASVLRALADVLADGGVTEATFSGYLAAVGAMPAKGKQRGATWPVATILPFLADPARHLFVKPLATQAAAERVKVELEYRADLNWTTYARSLKLADELRARLADHGCRDLMDVQAFMSLVA